MRVFIVDDHHPLICVAVTAAAEAEGGEVVGVAGSGREALEAIPRVRPDVVVLDIRLPDMSGFAIAQQLQSLLPSVRILALSGYIDDFIQMEIDRLRLAGFVHKASVSLTYLRTALATVHAGRTYFCPRYASFRAKVQADPNAMRKILTPTELKVLALIGCGFDDAEISAQLGSGRTTVLKHRSNLLHKLKLTNSPQLVRVAVDLGLSPPQSDGDSV